MRSRALLLSLALLFVSACGSVDDGGAAPDEALIEVGRGLYATNCAECHGGDLRGTDQGPSFLSEVYEPNHHGDGAFLVAAMTGVAPHHWNFGPMPPVVGITEEDVEAIVAYIRDVQDTRGFEPYPP